jgi:hypothetical protein
MFTGYHIGGEFSTAFFTAASSVATPLPAVDVKVILARMSQGWGARKVRRWACAAFLVAGWASPEGSARAEEAPAAEKGKWAIISERLLADLEKEGKKPAWPGKATGVVTDRTTRDAFVLIPGQGVWRTAGKGAKFERVDGGKTWKDAAPLPEPGCRVDWFGNYAWDPAGNVFHFANMGQPAWKSES